MFYIFLPHIDTCFCINTKSQIYKNRKGAKNVSEICGFLRNEKTLLFSFFQQYPSANINKHISIKSIFNWSICLTAPADERLVAITQTSLYCTISFMNRYIATVTQNWIIAMCLLTYTIGPLTFLFLAVRYTTNTATPLLPREHRRAFHYWVDGNVPAVFHNQYILKSNAAATWRANTALNKAAWWLWVLTRWLWNWRLCRV